MLRFSSLVWLVVVLGIFTQSLGIIQWDTCEGIADHPSITEGNYYNLCIEDEEFVEQAHAWTFIKSQIINSVFEDCAFQNTKEKTTTLTESNWANVVFKNTRFGSFTDEPMTFDQLVMTNVVFDECTFHNTADLNFTKFMFNNVTFLNSRFESDANFELGEMNTVKFENCLFASSASAKTPSGKDAFRIRQVTARDLQIINTTTINPVRIEGAAIANMQVNDSTISEYWCHSDPATDDNKGEVKYYSGFNDTSFQEVKFKGDVHCDLTTFRGLFNGNVTYEGNAYFQNGDILDLYWDEVNMKSGDGEPVTLDFSKTRIKRRVLANTTIMGNANFMGAEIETLFVNNFIAAKPKFDDTMFKEQEFIDGHCCSRVCVNLKCMCNVTEPSGVCPKGGRDVNVSAPQGCFPGIAQVSRHDGMVMTMAELEIAEKIAVGKGEHSDVFFFGHRDPDVESDYIAISHTGSDTPLRMSPGHYLYVDGKLATARSVHSGQRLRDARGNDVLNVIGVKVERHAGVYAPTTMHGDLVVDGVTVSSYTDALHPGLAHKLLHPLRLLYRYGLDSVVSRFTLLHRRSFEHVPRALGIGRGPQVLGN